MYRTIYLLRDPRDNAVRYVGVTAGLLSHRLGKHVWDRRKPSEKGRWVAELYAHGLRPIIEPVEIVSADWMEREVAAIAKCRAIGCDLLNISEGGYGHAGVRHSDSSKRAISKGKIGRPFICSDNEGRIAKIKAAQRGRPKSPESVERMRAALTGRINTPDHRQQLVKEMFAAGKSRNAISTKIKMDHRTVTRILSAT